MDGFFLKNEVRMTIKQSFMEQSLVKDYKTRPIEVLNYVLDRFAKSKYAFKFGKQVATMNVIGFQVHQDIQSYDFYTPDTNYSQSWSMSPFITTKQRIYDHKDGTLSVYSANGGKLMDDAVEEKMDYDTFIMKYGKLPKREYKVINRFTSKENRIHDAYLYPESNQNQTSRIIFGSLIYDIREDTIKQAKLTEDENGYLLDFELDVRYALDYYASQMMNTGSLFEPPKFFSSHVSIYFDKDGNLTKVKCHDEFSGKTGFISAKVSMESLLLYFTSENEVFEYNGKKEKLEVPTPHSRFNANDLFQS